jgi:PPOX class probable F420-dependent enzyme
MTLSQLPFQAAGGQPAFAASDLERFVAAPRVGILAYARRDGRPNQVPIWYAYRDGKFLMLTSPTSPKAKALARAPKACLTIQDETPPYRAVVVDGDVQLTKTTPDAGLNSELAMRYFGKIGGKEYEKMTAADNAKHGLVLITLTPKAVRGFDNHRMIGAPLRVYMRIRNLLPIPRSWI